MNRIRTTLIVYMAVATFFGIWAYSSNLTRKISLQKKVEIVFFSDSENDTKGFEVYLLEYDPSKRSFRFISSDRRMKVREISYNKAYEALRQMREEEPNRDDFFYMQLPFKSTNPHEYLTSFTNSWRSDFEGTWEFISLAIKSKSKGNCNLSWPDILTLLVEFFHSSSINFSYQEINLKKKNIESDIEQAPKNESIKIKFIDASGLKNNVEKTFAYLRANGFDPVDYKRAKVKKKTEIISPSEDISVAQKLAMILKMRYVEIKVEKEKYNIYGAKIMAGQDFNWR